jgi:hypothetical protein
MALQEL